MASAASEPRRTPRLRKIMILAAVCAASLLAAGCGPSVDDVDRADRPPCPVRTVEVGTGATESSATLAGVTEPIRRVTPSTRLMAKVVQADFSAGDRVEAERVLVRLDVKDLEAKRKQVLSAVEATRTAYGIAEANLRRMQDLAESGSTAQTSLEQMQINHAQAFSAMVAAGSALTELDTNLAYATIRAPFDGIIVQRLVEVGNTVGPGQSLFVIEDDSRLRVVASIGIEAAGGIKPQQKVAVRIDDQVVEGEVEAVVSSGDTRAPGLSVNILVDNPERKFKTGTLATVETPLVDGRAEVVVPRSALIRRGNLTGVFVVAEGRAILRWLVIEDVPGVQVPVITGLREGERIILAPDPACVNDGRLVAESN